MMSGVVLDMISGVVLDSSGAPERMHAASVPPLACRSEDSQPGHSPAAGTHRADGSAGLSNGVLLRTEVDHVTGQLSDTRTRFLGTLPPKLLATTVRRSPQLLLPGTERMRMLLRPASLLASRSMRRRRFTAVCV